jgi:tetratricopeptide (TPR) repeat protein
MGKFARVNAVLAGCAAVVALSGCGKLKSRDQQNQGVHDFANAKYADAIEHFKQAVDLDPSNPTAREYLAVSYFAQWIPGAESPQNLEFSARAKEEFGKVLAENPKDSDALSYLSSMAYSEAASLPQEQKLAKYNEAADWNHKLIEVDPNNKQAYYTLGVIAYNKWHPAFIYAELNLKPPMKSDDPGPIKDKKVKEDLKKEWGPQLDQGMADLQKSLDIDKDYADSMVYMNLLIREKAYLVDDKAEYEKEVATANDWLQKALDTKKANAAKAATTSGGIVQDSSK